MPWCGYHTATRKKTQQRPFWLDYGALAEQTEETMSKLQRDKGQRGEREIAGILSDLLGVSVSRRVRQHDGDSDLVGVPGWCIEVKNCADIRLAEWWRQACEQAEATGTGNIPVLLYKLPRRGWRARWPLSASLVMQSAANWLDERYTVDGYPEGWAAVVREGWAHGR